MYYLLAFLADVGITGGFSINKLYRTRVAYNAQNIAWKIAIGSAVSFALFFAISGFTMQCNAFVFTMSVCMCVISILSELITFTAYGKGQISLYTVFQMQGGMLLPFIYGIFFGNPLKWSNILGIVIMMGALILTVKPQKGKRQPLSRGFVLLCIAIFFVNGSVSIISYIYSNDPRNLGPQNYLMVKSLILGTAAVGVCLFGHKGMEACSQKERITRYVLIVGGTLVDSLSYFAQLLSAAHLPAVVLYPVITGGTVVLTAVAGRIFFHEKSSRTAVMGIVLSFLATLLFVI